MKKILKKQIIYVVGRLTKKYIYTGKGMISYKNETNDITNNETKL